MRVDGLDAIRARTLHRLRTGSAEAPLRPARRTLGANGKRCAPVLRPSIRRAPFARASRERRMVHEDRPFAVVPQLLQPASRSTGAGPFLCASPCRSGARQRVRQGCRKNRKVGAVVAASWLDCFMRGRLLALSRRRARPGRQGWRISRGSRRGTAVRAASTRPAGGRALLRRRRDRVCAPRRR